MNIGEANDVFLLCRWLSWDDEIGSDRAKGAAVRLLTRAGDRLMVGDAAVSVEKRLGYAIDRIVETRVTAVLNADDNRDEAQR